MKTRLGISFAIVVLLSLGAHSQTGQSKLPDTPQGRIIGAFVNAINMCQ